MSTSPQIAALAATHGDVQVLPTTFAQLRFWLLDQIGDEGGAFTIPMALRLTGPLDVAVLDAALNVIVGRHESLRTVFALEGEEPVQVVIPSLRIPVVAEDVRAVPLEAREDTIRARADANANFRFDLAKGPLFRASLLRVADDEYVLYMAMHHIVGDGWSVGVLYSELERAYAALVSGSEPALDALPLQYPDFAVWQRRAMQGGAAARQLAYWTDRLRSLPTLELSTDRPRPAFQTMNGGKRERVIGASAVEAMRLLARNEGATPYMAFLSAFVVLLHRYTSQTDLIVGSIASGRSRAEVEPLIGLFVNTLAIRADVEGDPTFVELLRRVREAATAAYANQDVPFEQVIDAVQPTRDRSRSPIFQVAFQLLEGLGRDLRLPGIVMQRVRGSKDTTKFDLTLMLHAAPEGALRAVIEYNSDLFDVETVDRMLAHYEVLLTGIVSDPRRVVSAIPILAVGERDALLVTSRGSRLSQAPSCVHAMVEAQVDATPSAIAVADASNTLTYAELESRANKLAAHLRALGVARGDAVAICLHRDVALLVALFATLKTGAHYVPLDPDYPSDRLAFILADAGAKIVIAASDTRDRLPDSAARALVLDVERDDIAGRPDVRVNAGVSTEDLAYVLHTSGSTGKPKGVMIPHRAVSNLLRSMADRPGLKASDAIVAVTTLSFDIAGLELWLPLIVGARVVVASRATAVDGIALARLVNDTASAVGDGHALLQATPATWRLLLDAGWMGTAGLRMLCGGEAWPPDLAAALLTRGESLWNVYGPTETTIWSSVFSIEGAGPIMLGSPIANTSLYVLDACGALVPPGVPGELYIGGDGVARGYLNRPDLTAERFARDPFVAEPDARMYRTGDLVRRRGTSALEYLGRLDQQVKLRGFRIELGEIEAALVGLPGVARAVVVVRAHNNDTHLVAYIVASDVSKPPDIEAFQEGLRRSLPDYMVPALFVCVDAFPLTPNGKIDRRALPEPSGADAPQRKPPVAPRTPLEEQIATVWAAVLGVDRVGVEDDFFALGGHSLLAMRVVARLADMLPARLTIGALFDARTVAGLATLVLRKMAEAERAAPDDDLAAMLAELEGLSDEDAAQMLAGERRAP